MKNEYDVTLGYDDDADAVICIYFDTEGPETADLEEVAGPGVKAHGPSSFDDWTDDDYRNLVIQLLGIEE